MNKFILSIISISLFFSVYTNTINAQQNKSFSDDISVFPSEFKIFMMVNISENDKILLESYMLKWTQNVYDNVTKDNIIRISNKLLQNKAQQYPHFKDFILIQNAFLDNGRINDYEEWEKGFEYMLDKKASLRALTQFQSSALDLMLNNNLYKSASTQWQINQSDFSFRFNGKTSFVEFADIDLTCYAKRDSIKIYETSGRYYPNENLWVGKSGSVTWERSGYDASEVFAKLSNYQIDVTKSEYTADSVVFTYTSFLKQPIIGRLNDKVMQFSDASNIYFPEIQSYAEEFKIKNLYKNVDFAGGLTFAGSKIYGKGNAESPALLIFTRSDTTLLKAESDIFIINKNNVKSNTTSVAIYVGKDSIYHPYTGFVYNAEERELSVQQTEAINSKGAFLNSYHAISMKFGTLNWFIDEPFINFVPSKGSANGNANFQSVNYFSDSYFRKLQGNDMQNPIVSIYLFAESVKRNHFNTLEFAKYRRLSLTQTRHFLMQMVSEGFLFFNIETDLTVIRPRLYDYIKASMGKIDYDVIDFYSVTDAPLENGVLDLRNMDLTMNGIPYIQVSDSQNVKIYPTDNQIIMKKNRNIQFNGKIEAGNFTFYGNNYFFNYDSFSINLQNVDSLKILVTVGTDNFDQPIKKQLKSTLENLTGELLIDKPSNKSGLKQNPQYPIFNSRENCYVYYNNSSSQGDAYPRKDFYFKIDPFTRDSLDNFGLKDLVFDGSFSSSNIFPEFRQRLNVQEDFSLGFTQITPAEGLPLYGGKGNFYDTINLSNKGLRGKGKIDYITSTTWADEFMFYPDSLNSHAKEFKNAKQTSGTEYPMASATDLYIHWRPYAEKFYAYNKKTPFTIINQQNTLTGMLLLEPSGMSGSGHKDLTTAEMDSKNYQYQSNGFRADTSDFYLKSIKSTGFTVLTHNVNANINYDAQKGTFRSNDPYTLVEFPENKYISYLDYFVWDMARKEFKLGSEKEYTTEEQRAPYVLDDIAGPRFISVHKAQDSLNWVSPDALYDYANNLIKANDVKYIRVADARIYPHKEKVVVETDAKMETLFESNVIADIDSNYHTFYRSTIEIAGQKRYSGKGKHDYIDEDKKVQILNFENIFVDPTNVKTRAEAAVIEPDSFTLSPVYQYQGKVDIVSEQKEMNFTGGVKLTSPCVNMGEQWLRFKTTIYPDSIYFPIPEEAIDLNRQRTYAGMLMANDSIHIYPAWLNPRKLFSDTYIISSSGYLFYDKPMDRYKISSLAKMTDLSIPGNYITLKQNPCELYGEGILNLGIDLWQVKLKNTGTINYVFDSNSVDVHTQMGINFFFDNAILKNMQTHLDSVANLVGRAEITESYLKGLNELLFVSDSSKGVKAESLITDTLQTIPKELAFSIFFSDVHLKWYQKTKSYRSEGKINIASIGDKYIGLSCEGYMELQRKRSGDLFDVFFKIDEQNWYYFGYNRGVMQAFSSNQSFNDALTLLKPNKRKLKVRSGGMPYIYMVSTNENMNRFLTRFRTALFLEERETPEETPENIEAPVQENVPVNDSIIAPEITLPANDSVPVPNGNIETPASDSISKEAPKTEDFKEFFK